ncbi:MAG: TRAP transporter small permease subunit [Rhizobiaceae bacterium]|nr:TRAP transporter small permease subunit [Rhizobiaceae bacterium]MCV0408996.1 TRAP transporter small permease subunit [Rhizobiaceae bacterium]
MGPAAAFLIRLSAGLNRVALYGAAAAVLVMLFAAGYQVIARYIFAAPPIWTEELARRAMVWAGMLGATVAFYQRTDPNLFPQMLDVTGRIGKALTLIRSAGVAIFAFPILYYSLFGPNMNLARGFIGRSLDRKGEMLAISMAWFTSAVPIAFLIIAVHVAAQIAAAFAREARPAEPAREDIPV